MLVQRKLTPLSLIILLITGFGFELRLQVRFKQEHWKIPRGAYRGAGAYFFLRSGDD